MLIETFLYFAGSDIFALENFGETILTLLGLQN